MASSRILLLAAILLALAASFQARGQSMPPSPAMAPTPSSSGGNCTLKDAVTLGVCLNIQPGRTSLFGKNRCCNRIQGTQNVVNCLCLTFMLAGGFVGSIGSGLVGTIAANGVNSVLGVCGMPRIVNLVCQMASVSV